MVDFYHEGIYVRISSCYFLLLEELIVYDIEGQV